MGRRDGIRQKPAMSRWNNLTRLAEGEQDGSEFRPRVSYLGLESSANAIRIDVEPIALKCQCRAAVKLWLRCPHLQDWTARFLSPGS